jgi:hypothetical protein
MVFEAVLCHDGGRGAGGSQKLQVRLKMATDKLSVDTGSEYPYL